MYICRRLSGAVIADQYSRVNVFLCRAETCLYAGAPVPCSCAQFTINAKPWITTQVRHPTHAHWTHPLMQSSRARLACRRSRVDDVTRCRVLHPLGDNVIRQGFRWHIYLDANHLCRPVGRNFHTGSEFLHRVRLTGAGVFGPTPRRNQSPPKKSKVWIKLY
jgi:hypothetical protein